MMRNAVDSSTIFAIGYDPVTKTLEIEFHKSGKKQNINPVYTYAPISQERFAEFWKSAKSPINPEGSLGKYFKDYIRHDQSLTVTRVSPEAA